MKLGIASRLVVQAALATAVVAQGPPVWADAYLNISICTWVQPRVALLQDTIYIDGGKTWWSPGLRDGRIDTPVGGNVNSGIVLSYNLSNPFDQDTNITDIIFKNSMSKAIGGSGNAAGAAPNFYDGAMLANDDQFYLYGGAVFRNNDVYDPPDKDEVIGYQAYRYGPERVWQKGFTKENLPDGMTRYVAYGGAANAPSENKAWYFSGLVAPNKGPIDFNNFPNNTDLAQNISNLLVTVDMESQRKGSWSNTKLPSSVSGRANPEVVWVPVGQQGILVVVGGVTYPEWAGTKEFRESDDPEASEEESSVFTQVIDVYDIANEKWYKQKTSGGDPGIRTRGCTVMAAAADYSSFNIYYYGGFDGIHLKDDFYDDVWVLSLPSFTWTKISDGTSLHARSGHKCIKPYPDQMIAVGGYTPEAGNGLSCLEKGPLVVYNITSGEWMDSYHPNNHGEYGIPEKVQSVIGGDAGGKATVTQPPSGWATSSLGKVFETQYNYSKISTYYPYPVEAGETGRPTIPGGDDNKDGGGGSGLPSWVAPVLGVVLGLVLLTGIIVLFCLWRRRKIFKNRTSEPGTEDAGMRIMSWMRGQQGQAMEKAPTVTTSEEMPASPSVGHARAVTMVPVNPRSYSHGHYEMDNTGLVELDDTSPPAELHSTGFTPVGGMRSHSGFDSSNQSRTMSKPSSISGDNSEFNDAVSQTSVRLQNDDPYGIDSPTLAASPQDPTPRSMRDSNVSQITARASHLRNLSDTTVSSEGTQADVRSPPERVSHADVEPILETLEETSSRPSAGPRMDSGVLPTSTLPVDTPVSPPTADELPGSDYITVKDLVSPIGKSVYPDDGEGSGRK